MLILAKLYSSVDLVSQAEARATGGAGAGTNLYGCAQLGNEVGGCAKWMPVRTTSDGRVIVTSNRVLRHGHTASCLSVVGVGRA